MKVTFFSTRILRVILFLSVGMLGFGAFCPGETPVPKREYKVGVLANHGKDIAIQQWSNTIENLNDAISEAHFVLIPLDFDEMNTQMATESLDFAITNPLFYVLYETQDHAQALATLKSIGSESSEGRFGSVIFTSAAHPDIREIEDLRGKTVAAVDRLSFGGWVAALREFRKKGLHEEKDFQWTVLGTVYKVTEAVLKGNVDAGIVRTGVLEELSALGKIRLQDIRVLHPMNTPGDALMSSTPLYPDWAFLRMHHSPLSLAEKISKTLLATPSDDLAAVTGQYEGWTVPQNYASVHECLKELQLPPYENFGKIQLKDVFQAYGVWILAGGIFCLALMLMLAGVLLAGQSIQKDIRRRISSRTLIGFFLLITAGVAFGGNAYYQQYLRDQRENGEQVLIGIAENKRIQIENWITERAQHAYRMAHDTSLKDALEHLEAKPGDPQILDRLQAILQEVRRGEGFYGAAVISSDGRLLLSTDDQEFSETVSQWQMLLEKARSHSGVQWGKAYVCSKDGLPMMDEGIRIGKNEGKEEGFKVLGFVILRSNLAEHLFPSIEEWAGRRQSGEILLATQDHSDAVIINSPRLQSKAPFTLRLSMEDTRHPMVMALRGHEGSMKGWDYRDIPVISAIRNIPEIAWALIVKMDESEIYENASLRKWMVTTICLSLILLTAAILGFLNKVQHAAFFEQMYRSEVERKALIKHFDYLIKYANDIILLLNEEGVIVEANDRALSLYGYDAQTIQSLRIYDLTHPDELSRNKREFNQATGDSGVRFETLHRRKNKETFPVEISARTLFIEEKPYWQAIIRDISERKEREAALQQSEEKYKLLAEGLKDMVIRVSLTGHIEYVSAAAMEFGGYDPKEEIGAFMGKYFANPMELTKTLKLMKEMVIDRKSASTEFLYKPKNREPFYCEVTGKPLIRNGKVISFQCVMRDTSERRKAEETLRLRETTLRTITDSAQDAIVMLDHDGLVSFWNPAAERIFGWSKNEILGKPLHPLIAPSRYHEAHQKAFPYFQKTGQGSAVGKTLELGGLRKDGTEIMIELSLSAIQIEGKWGSVGLLRDITNRKRAEAQMHLQTTALESAANAIVILDREAKIIWVNPAFTTITGYSAKEAIGQNPRVLKSGKHEEAFYKNLWGTVLAGAVWNGEIINKRKDGVLYTEEMTITPVKNKEGEVTHFIAIKQDITARKQFEEHQQRAQRMESIGLLAGGVAHDFNNILTVIGGYVDFLLENSEAMKNHGMEIQEIKEAVKRAQALVKQLLVFGRREVSSPKVFSPDVLIKDLEPMLHRLIKPPVEMVISGDQPLGTVKADPSQIEQVVMNLVVNARDAMPQGGKIVVESRNVVLEEEYAEHYTNIPAGAYVVISVSDNGTGMSDEVRKHIFEPFFTTKPKGKGTGLGLATCYGIVRQNHGVINVYSEEGKGTVVKVFLPVTGEAAELLTSQKKNTEITGGSETILLAEDENSVRHLAVSLLQKKGYRVLAAENGAAALEISRSLQKETIHLLVTDIIMPGMNGRDLAEQILKERAGIRVLFVSGFTDDAIVHHGVLSGNLNFLQKPFTQRSLCGKVRDVLDGKK